MLETHQGRARVHAAKIERRVGITAGNREEEPGEEEAACFGENEAGNGGSSTARDGQAGTREGTISEGTQGEIRNRKEKGEACLLPGRVRLLLFMLTWLALQR